MKLEVLISCMHETDTSIIQRENVQSDVLIINQCDRNSREDVEFINKKGDKCLARFIHTTERGLSRSRNMAIKNAVGDVCLICDDDEVLEDDYVEKIIGAFNDNPKYEILAFKLTQPHIKYDEASYDVGIFRAAKIGSYQIAFRKNNLVTAIRFNEKMGSGTGNGGGEENKFLIDALKKGAKIKYVPLLIASVAQTESQWFFGFTEGYWINRGWTSRQIYGSILGIIYIIYVALVRARAYDKKHSIPKIIKLLFQGFVSIR